MAKDKGYNVLLMDGQLDVHVVSLFEQKFEKCSFTRVDSDVVDRLIVKDDTLADQLPAEKATILSESFQSLMPTIDKAMFNVSTSAMGTATAPVIITQNEYMRRMKEQAQLQPGMSFYGDMPDSYNVVLNSDHSLVQGVLADVESACPELVELESQLSDARAAENALNEAQKGKKPEEISQSQKDELEEVQKQVIDLQEKKKNDIAAAVSDNQVVKQLIDLALLQNGMLRGEALSNFIKRSVDLI